MKIILVLVTCCLNLIQIIDSTKYQTVVSDELLPYDIDKSVTDNHETYFEFDNFIFEEIDDDVVRIGGYLKALKTMDPQLPLNTFVRTQFLQQSTWVEGPIRLTMPSLCPELVNPSRFWYNVSKLWTKCPPEAGDIYMVEQHNIDMLVNLPPSMPITKWKFYALFVQGAAGFEKTKWGMTFQLEFVQLKRRTGIF